MIMFPPWRFKLRQAQVAFDEGRLEDAARIASEAELAQYLPVRELIVQLGEQLARRALERAAAGDFSGAWRDLDQARQLAGDTSDCQRLQQAVAEVALEDIVQHLKASDFRGADARLDAIARRHIPGFSTHTLREIARRLESAYKLGQRGKFSEAQEQLTAAAVLRPDLALLDDQKRHYQQRAERSRALEQQLHAALAASDWNNVLTCASELLSIAPENRVARDARKRAWVEAGAAMTDSRHFPETHYWTALTDGGGLQDQSTRAASAAVKTASRFMLWIDAVGGYLVCLGDEIVLGQAVPGARIDVPIQADISRRHAKLIRRGEGYILQPLGGRVTLGDKPVLEPALLSDGDEIGLGEGVRLRFRKPHVLSASARLEMLSGHRTQPFADSVILMAESCVLGPKSLNHVVCREWSNDVVLYRSDNKIMCRAMESIEIDSRLYDGRGPLQPGSHVIGTDFSLTLEPV